MGGGGIGRLHQEDFCQPLGRMPSPKYEQRGAQPSVTWFAPLYDLATGLLYDSRDVDRSVARIRQRQWDKAATTLGLSVDLLTARVSHLARGFPKAFNSAVHSMIAVPGSEVVLERV